MDNTIEEIEQDILTDIPESPKKVEKICRECKREGVPCLKNRRLCSECKSQLAKAKTFNVNTIKIEDIKSIEDKILARSNKKTQKEIYKAEIDRLTALLKTKETLKEETLPPLLNQEAIPIEVPIEIPVEIPVEIPPVEIIKEVPKEIIKEVPKEVIKEVVKEVYDQFQHYNPTPFDHNIRKAQPGKYFRNNQYNDRGGWR